MRLDERTMRLIAVGVSFAVNCQTCLQINVARALENGGDEQEILESIEIAKLVRQGAVSAMDRYMAGLNRSILLAGVPEKACECKPQNS